MEFRYIYRQLPLTQIPIVLASNWIWKNRWQHIYTSIDNTKCTRIYPYSKINLWKWWLQSNVCYYFLSKEVFQINTLFLCLHWQALYSNLFHTLPLIRIFFLHIQISLCTLIINFPKSSQQIKIKLDKKDNAYRWENKKHYLKWPHCSSALLVISEAVQDVKQTLTALG